MSLTTPPEPENGDNNNILEKAFKLEKPNTDGLSMEQKFSVQKEVFLIEDVFAEAQRKITTLNKSQILEELATFAKNYLINSKVQNISLLEMVKTSQEKEVLPLKIPQITPEKKYQLQREYGQGEMKWGRDQQGEAILELRVDSKSLWVPHTDSQWDSLLEFSIRSKDMPSDVSNGFPEFQFLRNVLGWKLKGK
jgi:hypothetical protein